MNILIPLIVCLIVAIIAFFIGKSYSKVIKPTSEEILKYSIDNVKFVNELHPLVKQIYLYFIDKNTLKHFCELSHDIKVDVINVKFWKCNEVHNRVFTAIHEDTLKLLGSTVHEINTALTLADKTILDHIAKAIIINNKQFISRLFI